jgi:hypothetical protein
VQLTDTELVFMRSASSIAPSAPSSAVSARRTRRLAEQSARRARRRPTIVSTGLALALVGAVGFATVPAAHAEASHVSAVGDSALTMTLASFKTPAAEAPIITANGTDTGSTEMRAALAAADASVAAAAKVTADIQASGLDVGEPETTVDTAALQKAEDRLTAANLLPAPLVLGLISDVNDLVTPVNERVAGLRGSLDAAVAKKAAEEAAAEAARVAAEQAAAAAAKKAAPRASSGGAPALAASGTSAAEAQATARGMLSARGWGDDQFSCLVSLWNKESGWNYQAYNSSSGATGIPQALPGSKMATAGADWQTNPATQISWGLGYISGRYGTPCGAWSHSQSTGWY